LPYAYLELFYGYYLALFYLESIKLKIKLSIVIPVYYNEKNLPVTYFMLKEKVLSKLEDYELILVDDGSEDDSWSEMQKIRAQDNKVKLIRLSQFWFNYCSISRFELCLW
jgi:cellulose synthase/poly-beta-1,6-N-acetylglucosamine synthase-like glycosyltransferase